MMSVLVIGAWVCSKKCYWNFRWPHRLLTSWGPTFVAVASPHPWFQDLIHLLVCVVEFESQSISQSAAPRPPTVVSFVSLVIKRHRSSRDSANNSRKPLLRNVGRIQHQVCGSCWGHQEKRIFVKISSKSKWKLVVEKKKTWHKTINGTVQMGSKLSFPTPTN